MDRFDIIVIGGGSAGSAAAGRLAEDGTRRVCLVEAGGSNDIIRVKTPGFMPLIPKASNYRYDTVPQAGLDRDERLKNLRGAFELRKGRGGCGDGGLRGRQILLVDDVFTTGATTSECARVLRRAGGLKKWWSLR